MLVRVHPASLPVRVPQRDLRAVRDLKRLPLDDRAQAAFERRLKRRRHERVVHSGLGQDGQVDPKGADVDGRRHEGDEPGAHYKLLGQLDAVETTIRKSAPKVPEEDEAAEPAGVDGEVLDGEGGAHEDGGGRNPGPPTGAKGARVVSSESEDAQQGPEAE